jgi:bla regulator protein blaR1
MNVNFLADVWRDFAPGLGNHLWQSTIFAAVVAGLALALRGNQARTRYWLWLAASLKFLFPFSLLVSVGSYLAIPHTKIAPSAVYYSAFEQFGQPFAIEDGGASYAHSIPVTAAAHPATYYLPLLLVVWLVGSLVVLAVWLARWYRISAIAKSATPLQEGPEAAIVAQLQQGDAVRDKVGIVGTAATIEPGIFGIFRPVLLWPALISGQLTEAHTESIVAHELCHVRRRDNLTATLHMLVESLFWFHPAVWWLGNRLVEDRERACDEAVVESGRERQVYAESILKVCEFCVESPLPCVPGVSGADLKRRIASIMSHRPARALSLGRKVLLGVAVVLAIAAPILAGAFHVPGNLSGSGLTATSSSAPKYSSVSITPSTDPGNDARVVLMISVDQFTSKNASLLQVIRQAYGVEDDRIVNAPAWLTTDKYDFVATAGSTLAGQNVEASGRVQKQMLQSVLADRLKLVAHSEVRDVPVYSLVLAKNGPKLTESTVSDTNSGASTAADSKTRRGGFHIEGSALIGNDVPIDALVFHLSRQLHRTVLNETGLSGTYEFTLRAPDGVAIGIDNSAPPESYEPALSAALTEQLGLTLEPREAKMEVLVIDHVEKPTTSASQAVSPETAPHFENASFKLDEPGSFGEVTIKADPEATAKVKANSAPIVSRVMWNNGELIANGATLHALILLTFPQLDDSQVSGGPDWIKTEVFNVHAKAGAALMAEWPKMTHEQRDAADRAMLQNMLVSNFGLKMHQEKKVEPTYALVVDNASKLQPFDGDCPPIAAITRPLAEELPAVVDPKTISPACGTMMMLPGEIRANNIRIGNLLRFLSIYSGRTVEDKTNLTKRYSINVKFTPDASVLAAMPPPPPGLNLPAADPNGPSLFDALVQQTGLRLVPQTGPVEMLVVDGATMPGQETAAGR